MKKKKWPLVSASWAYEIDLGYENFPLSWWGLTLPLTPQVEKNNCEIAILSLTLVLHTLVEGWYGLPAYQCTTKGDYLINLEVSTYLYCAMFISKHPICWGFSSNHYIPAHTYDECHKEIDLYYTYSVACDLRYGSTGMVAWGHVEMN